MKERDLTSLLLKKLPELLKGVDLVGISGEKYDLVKQNIFVIETSFQTPRGLVDVVIEVKNTDRIIPLRMAAQHVKKYVQETNLNAVPFVATQFLGEQAREALKEEGVGFLDLAGNFFMNSKNIYIKRIVTKNPFSDTPPLKNLFAPISSRIARAMLIEPKRTWKLNELAQETDVSLGQSSSVVERMIEQEYLFWNEERELELKNPTTLFEAWKNIYPTYQKQKYSFFSYEQSYEAIVNSVLQAGEEKKLQYAFGLFTGADIIAPFIRGIGKAQLYIQNMQDLDLWKANLNVQEVQGAGNIEFFVPYDKGVFYKIQQIKSNIAGEIPIVNNVQLYMDLFNDPARGEEAAKHLREVKLLY
jgi:hypothetical protein